MPLWSICSVPVENRSQSVDFWGRDWRELAIRASFSRFSSSSRRFISSLLTPRIAFSVDLKAENSDLFFGLIIIPRVVRI